MTNTPPNPPFNGPADPFAEPVDYTETTGYATPLYDQVDVETTTFTPTGSSDSSESKADVAKEQAAEVGATAAAEAKNVAGVAKEKAADVVGEAKTQVKDLFEQSKTTLREQAGAQQERVATGLRSLSDELQSMADNSDGSGVASDLVSQVASRAGSAASWLDGRDPGSLLDEVRTFAQRKPGTFIAIAAIAGVVAGRLTRSVATVVKEEHEEASTPTSGASLSAPYPSAITPPDAWPAPVPPAAIPTVPPTATGL